MWTNHLKCKIDVWFLEILWIKWFDHSLKRTDQFLHVANNRFRSTVHKYLNMCIDREIIRSMFVIILCTNINLWWSSQFPSSFEQFVFFPVLWAFEIFHSISLHQNIILFQCYRSFRVFWWGKNLNFGFFWTSSNQNSWKLKCWYIKFWKLKNDFKKNA